MDKWGRAFFQGVRPVRIVDEQNTRFNTFWKSVDLWILSCNIDINAAKNRVKQGGVTIIGEPVTLKAQLIDSAVGESFIV